VPDEQCSSDDILVLSACFRAGRAGASTDHSCIMFDVDLPTCTLKKGTSNAHWYEPSLMASLIRLIGSDGLRLTRMVSDCLPHQADWF
jgi:hypothetical protein